MGHYINKVYEKYKDLYQGTFFEHFGDLNDCDSRESGKIDYRLIDVLFIVISGILCGHDDWKSISTWASAGTTQQWLKKHIALENGTPSESAIKSIFSIITPEAFSSRFFEWVRAGLNLPEKDIISIDGKTSKGSRSKSPGQKGLHMVSALCHSHGLILGQTKTDEKSNEITAIPELLGQLMIKGCIVTIDAMGAQKKIVTQIVNENEADYVINLKGNQETLHEEVKTYFEDLKEDGMIENLHQMEVKEKDHSYVEKEQIQMHRTFEKGHDRIEKRTYIYSTDLDWMVDAKKDWIGLTGIGLVIRETEHLT